VTSPSVTLALAHFRPMFDCRIPRPLHPVVHESVSHYVVLGTFAVSLGRSGPCDHRACAQLARRDPGRRVRGERSRLAYDQRPVRTRRPETAGPLPTDNHRGNRDIHRLGHAAMEPRASNGRWRHNAARGHARRCKLWGPWSQEVSIRSRAPHPLPVRIGSPPPPVAVDGIPGKWRKRANGKKEHPPIFTYM
jgi:hypothetical protein